MMSETKIINISDGQLRGCVEKTITGLSYLSFKGIPFAEPPVGPLRFQPPKTVNPWSGIRDALAHGPSAYGYNFFNKTLAENCSEDCLYLNVYAPEDVSVKRPVLFWIHGGAYNCGNSSTNMYGPDYLVEKGVVIVTTNYRLGALGFLSLQNAACPGNNGFKDQVLALQWVQRNISSFGGDANNVTIFGESAGGSSVQFLLLSPLSKGLFHGAITQSGTVFNPRGIARKPVAMAFKLGELLGCKTDDPRVLLEYLMTADPKQLTDFNINVNCTREVEPYGDHLVFPFVPVIEPNLPGAFICATPDELLQRGQVHDVPYIIGVNTLEGLIALKKGEPIKPLNSIPDLETLIPLNLNIKRGTEQSTEICEKIKQFYFSNGFNERAYVNALSCIYFLIGTDKFIRGLTKIKSRKSKTYFYEFTYEGTIGAVIRALMGYANWKGTIHAEELMYLWRAHMMPPSYEINDADKKIIECLTGLWTDFAKNKQPTPNDTVWKPFSDKDLNFLEIGNELQLKCDYEAKQLAFWRELYLEYSKL